MRRTIFTDHPSLRPTSWTRSGISTSFLPSRSKGSFLASLSTPRSFRCFIFSSMLLVTHLWLWSGRIDLCSLTRNCINAEIPGARDSGVQIQTSKSKHLGKKRLIDSGSSFPNKYGTTYIGFFMSWVYVGAHCQRGEISH